MAVNQGIQRYKEVVKKSKSKGRQPEPKKIEKDKKEIPIATKSARTSKESKTEKTVLPTKVEKTKSKNKTIEVTPEVNAALEEKVAAEEAAKEEAAIQAEITAELEQDREQTSKLIKEDYSPSNTSRERLILEYAPLIKYIAQKIAARLPANIELDDLMSSGVIGLMDAIDKYDSSRDNKFKTYAEFRIRGAILDELRAQDWVPRSVREKAKQLERIYIRIEQEKGRQAKDEEVCEALGVSQEEYHDMLNQVRSVSLLSFEDLANFSKADKRALHNLGENSLRNSNPLNEITVATIKRVIATAIQDLPEKQRLVLSLYYYEDLNLKEIGRVLDVTESRVSQLHTQAIIKLKTRLRSHWDEFVALLA